MKKTVFFFYFKNSASNAILNNGVKTQQCIRKMMFLIFEPIFA
jgi:hypothetical protein